RRSTGPSAFGRSRPCGVPATACGRLGLVRLPIRLRLTLAFALGMAGILAGLGAFLYLRLGSELLRAIDLGLRSRAQVVAAGIDRQNVNFGDEPGALVSPTDSFAQVLDHSGRLLESTDAISTGRCSQPRRCGESAAPRSSSGTSRASPTRAGCSCFP